MSKATLVKNILSKKRPVHITFFVTGKCNARCKMCFYWKENIGKNELTLEEIQNIAKNYKHKLLWLALTGGEPFLRDDLPEIAEAFYKSSKPDYITIPSNGILAEKIARSTENILKKCPGSSIRVKLSIDGIGKVHDDIRGVPGGYDKLLDTYDILMKLKENHKNLDVGITITFSSFNKDTIKKTIDHIINSGKFDLGNMIPLSINYVRGDARDKQAKTITADEFKEISDYLSKIVAEKYKNKDFLTKMLIADEYLGKELIVDIVKSNKMMIPCFAAKSSIVITEEGTVYPCEILNTELGKLRDNDYSIDKIMKSENAKKIWKFISERKCVCTHECNMFANTLLNWRMYPKIYKKYRKMF